MAESTPSRRRRFVHNRLQMLHMAIILLLLAAQPLTVHGKNKKKQDSKEQKRKKAAAAQKLKQRRDARIVQKVLKAADKEDHYGVLGLRLIDWKVGGQQMNVTIPFLMKNKRTIKLPQFHLFQMTTDKIRRAYRTRAIAVHPDKNSHPEANQAFIAVENSASILADDSKRRDYNQMIFLARLKRRQSFQKRVNEVVHVVTGMLQKALWTVKSVLGPFAFPVAILGALII